MIKRLTIYLSLSLIFMVGCKKNISTGPALYLKNGLAGKYYSGDTLFLSLTFTDDEEVSQITYRIFFSDSDKPATVNVIPGFDYIESISLAGNTVFTQKMILIPVASATGTYFLDLTVSDNESESQNSQFTFELQNSIDSLPPSLTGTLVADSVAINSPASFEAFFSDDQELGEVSLVLKRKSDNDTLLSFPSILTGLSDTMSVALPGISTPGTYFIILNIRDKVNNQNVQQDTLTVF